MKGWENSKKHLWKLLYVGLCSHSISRSPKLLIVFSRYRFSLILKLKMFQKNNHANRTTEDIKVKMSTYNDILCDIGSVWIQQFCCSDFS